MLGDRIVDRVQNGCKAKSNHCRTFLFTRVAPLVFTRVDSVVLSENCGPKFLRNFNDVTQKRRRAAAEVDPMNCANKKSKNSC